MSLTKLLEFLFRFNISASDTATWIYVVMTLLVLGVGVGLIWGKSWNREWSLGGHPGSLGITFLCALSAAYAVFNLRAVSQMESFFDLQRDVLAKSLSESGSFNRNVLRSVFNHISPQGGQEGLTPPDEGGNELRLNNQGEALALAATAADQVRSELAKRVPFLLGVPVPSRSADEIATEAVDAVGFTQFPTVVTPANEWTRTAAALQANHALDTTAKNLEPGLRDLRRACLWLLWLSAGIAVILVPVNALNDIKRNPKV